jgi:hypothetical protein
MTKYRKKIAAVIATVITICVNMLEPARSILTISYFIKTGV